MITRDDRFHGRDDPPSWLRAARGLLLVTALGVAVGLLGLLLAWVATALG